MGPLLGIMILFNFELDLAKRRMGGGDEYPMMDSSAGCAMMCPQLKLSRSLKKLEIEARLPTTDSAFSALLAAMPNPNAPALNDDGTLKDAKEIEWINSPSDKSHPIALGN